MLLVFLYFVEIPEAVSHLFIILLLLHYRPLLSNWPLRQAAIIEDECCMSGCVLPTVSGLHGLTQHFLHLCWSNTVNSSCLAP